MEPIYRHRQTGVVTIAAISAALVVIAINWSRVGAETGGARIILSVVGLVLVLALFLFGSLTVTVDREAVRVWFGPGLLRKRFDVNRIMEARAVRNRWWYGWGIRITPHGWMYSVSGLDAVELLLGDGRRFRIGTDEPTALLNAITTARASR